MGQVRDVDVFLLNLPRFKGNLERLPGKKKRAFENLIEKHRHGLHDTLCQVLDSPRYKTLERRFVQFLERPLPSASAHPARSKNGS